MTFEQTVIAAIATAIVGAILGAIGWFIRWLVSEVRYWRDLAITGTLNTERSLRQAEKLAEKAEQGAPDGP